MLQPEYREHDVEMMSLPKISRDGPPLHDLIPAQLHSASLTAIARRLTLYKEGNLLAGETEELIAYTKAWVWGLTKHGVCRQLNKIDFSNDHLLYLTLGELEYLVNHELIARQTYTHIHKDDPSKFFDLSRMRKFSTDFFSQQFRWKGLGLIAATDLNPNMDAIFFSLENSPDELQRALNTEFSN